MATPAEPGSPPLSAPLEVRLARQFVHRAGLTLLGWIDTFRNLGAFALITLGVLVTKFNHAPGVMRPLMVEQIHRCGVRLLPMITFLGVALGLVIIGQSIALLSRVNVTGLAGTVMVTAVVRELGPLAAAILVLARAGTANVIELGTARAQGEVQALEALNIDPIHYLVLPRVVGMAVGIFALTIYLIITALVSGYLFIFLNDVPLLPGDYFAQLAGALTWQDFALLGLKTTGFGSLIALVTCFQGLAQPLRLEDVAQSSTQAVVWSVAGCVVLDAAFIVVYLLL
jgi:phospholipid/cholesterol/gamma-HCH transport system permease protein